MEFPRTAADRLQVFAVVVERFGSEAIQRCSAKERQKVFAIVNTVVRQGAPMAAESVGQTSIALTITSETNASLIRAGQWKDERDALAVGCLSLLGCEFSLAAFR